MAFGEKKSFFGRLKEGLTRTKNNMVEKIEDVIFQRPEIDEEMMEELEETLILSRYRYGDDGENHRAPAQRYQDGKAGYPG